MPGMSPYLRKQRLQLLRRRKQEMEADIKVIEKNLAILRQMRRESSMRTKVATVTIMLSLVLPNGIEQYIRQPMVLHWYYLGVVGSVVLLDVGRELWLRKMIRGNRWRWRSLWRNELFGAALSSAMLAVAASIFTRYSGVPEAVIKMSRWLWPYLAEWLPQLLSKVVDWVVGGIVGGAAFELMRRRIHRYKRVFVHPALEDDSSKPNLSLARIRARRSRSARPPGG